MLVLIFCLPIIYSLNAAKTSPRPSTVKTDLPDNYYDDHSPLQDYTFWTASNSINESRFQEYPGMKLMKRKARIAIYSAMKNSRNCIRNCSMAPKCVSFNAIKKRSKKNGREILTCEFFSTYDGFFLQKKDATFYSMSAPRCPGYCEELHYLKVCAHCKCVSLCHANLTHYCDCTEQINATSKDCSQAVINYGELPLSALYHIDNGRQTLIAMCQFFKYNVVEALWVALYRRYHIHTKVFDKKRIAYRSGFRKAYHDNFFMGYDKISAYTNNGIDMTLGVVLVTKRKKDVYIEYDGFKMVEEDAEHHFYSTSYTKVRSFYCVNNFLDEKGSGSEKDCPEYDLLKNCDTGVIRLGDNKKEYISISFVIRPQYLNKIAESKILIRKPKDFKLLEGKEDNCISFEFSFPEQKSFRLLNLHRQGSLLFYIQYYTNAEKLILSYLGSFLIVVDDLRLKHNERHRVHLSVTMDGNQNRDVELSINNRVSSLLGTASMDMNGTVRISSGSKNVKNLFFLHDLYFNGQKAALDETV